MLFRFIFGIIAILLAFGIFGNSCLVSYRAREDIYNTSDFVSHIKILKKMEIPKEDLLVYDVEHLRVFKPAGEDQKLPPQIFTHIHDGICGVTRLLKNREYILSGNFQNNSTTLLIVTGDDVRRVEKGRFYSGSTTNESAKIEDDLALQKLLTL